MRKKDYLKRKKQLNKRFKIHRRFYSKCKRADLRKISKEMTGHVKNAIKALNRTFYDGRYERRAK